jgi:hypothetical protein
MALSFTSTINQAKTTWRVDAGLTFTQCDMTTSTGSAGADYATGFDLGAVAQQIGLNRVIAVLDCGVINKPTLRGQWAIASPGPNKLRFYIPAGTEVTTEIAANDVIRMLVAGI